MWHHNNSYKSEGSKPLLQRAGDGEDLPLKMMFYHYNGSTEQDSCTEYNPPVPYCLYSHREHRTSQLSLEIFHFQHRTSVSVFLNWPKVRISLWPTHLTEADWPYHEFSKWNGSSTTPLNSEPYQPRANSLRAACIHAAGPPSLSANRQIQRRERLHRGDEEKRCQETIYLTKNK